MPHARELPWVRRPVVPLMCARHAVIDELVSNCLPGFAAIVRSLNHLAEPAARLRRIQSILIYRRSLQVVDLPSGKVRAADVPAFALPVRRQYECPLACTNEYPYRTHHD